MLVIHHLHELTRPCRYVSTTSVEYGVCRYSTTVLSQAQRANGGKCNASGLFCGGGGAAQRCGRWEI